ncbi:hypothetical protein BX600DRAFT_513568 [Xylariales sp. PMI_506]|nr:hypothetical protein BX600DRAFT_513568 [Xylariales sp. PMI_506]
MFAAAVQPIPPFLADCPSSTHSIPPRSSLADTDEAPTLASSIFDYMDPIVAGSPTPLTEGFTVSHMQDALWTDYSAQPSPVFDPGAEIDGTGTTAIMRMGNISYRNNGSPCREPRIRPQSHISDHRSPKRKKNTHSSDDPAKLMITNLSQHVLCDDYYSLLGSELPRWVREGLWQEKPLKQAEFNSTSVAVMSAKSSKALPPSYAKLERAYLTVCQLYSRMGDDMIRNRAALIQLHIQYTETHQERRHAVSNLRTPSTVGRGNASHVIDCILENIHEGWATFDRRRRAELRAQFHDRKKYGKRWAQLANALGAGILLICSTKLANAVRSTAVTAKMLEETIERIKATKPDVVEILSIVSPVAEQLLKSECSEQAEVANVLLQVQICSQRRFGGIKP